ncbi:hypothetical protein ACQP2P_11785 [Dactylosporangium sp. CA-139114]|uniref:hypothetical protein n=1 Tax=Dactylosporangium sp. CA-139114 TaxID=3239931 RepID=UPI003D96FD46
MLDREAGLAAAGAYLAEDTKDWPADHAVRIWPERAFFDGVNLIVPYITVAFLDGDEEAELAGNMPIRVNTVTGECDILHLYDVIAYRKRGHKL